jgi:hypothetical protein
LKNNKLPSSTSCRNKLPFPTHANFLRHPAETDFRKKPSKAFVFAAETAPLPSSPSRNIVDPPKRLDSDSENAAVMPVPKHLHADD